MFFQNITPNIDLTGGTPLTIIKFNVVTGPDRNSKVQNY